MEENSLTHTKSNTQMLGKVHVHVHVPSHVVTCTCTCNYMYNPGDTCFNERWKKEASKVKQTNKAKQHSTPKAVTFSKKNELPRVGLEPTTLYTLDRALYH